MGREMNDCIDGSGNASSGESVEKLSYEPPQFESHRPLDIVSAYPDKSSELPGI